MTPDIKIGGRVFTPVNMERRTVLLDHHLMKVVQQSGCDNVLPVAKEQVRDYMIRMQNQILISGCACDLLGCFLLPVGKSERDWTPAMQRETVTHIAQCDQEEDRQVVAQLALEFVFGFFKRRLDSLRTSLSSSAAAAAGPANQSQDDQTAAA